jgi:hypothetical protein
LGIVYSYGLFSLTQATHERFKNGSKSYVVSFVEAASLKKTESRMMTSLKTGKMHKVRAGQIKKEPMDLHGRRKGRKWQTPHLTIDHVTAPLIPS